MQRSNIEKIAQNCEDKMLLAKVWDKINAGMQRSIPANTAFLSPREQEMTRYLFGAQEGLLYFGGYEDAERKMAVFLPEYLEESSLYDENSPIVCLRAQFYEGDTPTHRDFLGALMGCGISRESVGDICVGSGSCDFFVTSEIAPYLLQNFFRRNIIITGLSRKLYIFLCCEILDKIVELENKSDFITAIGNKLLFGVLCYILSVNHYAAFINGIHAAKHIQNGSFT